MNSFADYFKSYCLCPKLEKVYFEYLSNFKKVKYSVFVEGYLDKKFYNNALVKKLNCNLRGDVFSYVCNGKSGVIEITNYLFNKNMITKHSNNIFNIVDRDFNCLKDFNCNLESKITLTKYYSLESYAFIKENMDIILTHLNLFDVEKQIFYENFRIYLDLILDYEALLKCSVNDGISYISVEVLDDAKISFNGNLMIDKKFKSIVESKIKNLSEETFKDFQLTRDLLSKNYLNYRGHDLEKYFDFMMKYFKINVKLHDILSLEDIVKKMDIDLDLK